MAKVLVIDDDVMVAATIRNMLLAAGHDVVVALSGESGSSQLREVGFDLVICDIFMPGKDGIETLREVRARSAGIPIISMSGGASMTSGTLEATDLLRMAEILGATRTIQKPFRGSQLIALVDQILSPSASADDAWPGRY